MARNNIIPVYLITGFLESGKTTFINETLADEGFNKGEKTPQGMPIPQLTPVADKARFKEFSLMGIKPCVYYRMNTNIEDYRLALEYGAVGFTFDHPDIGGKILDELGARKLKK